MPLHRRALAGQQLGAIQRRRTSRVEAAYALARLRHVTDYDAAVEYMRRLSALVARSRRPALDCSRDV